MAALPGPRESRDLATGCLAESNWLWQCETNSHTSQTKQNQTIIIEGRPWRWQRNTTTFKPPLKKIITSVVVATAWFSGDICTALWRTMGRSNSLCPLQLYISSTTVSLTPGQCYTEFNEGALMNECSPSYSQQLCSWWEKDRSYCISLFVATGSLSKMLRLTHQQWFFNTSCNFPSLTFSKITQRPKHYQHITKKSICSLSPWILFCSLHYHNNEASVLKVIWQGLFMGSVCLHSL